MTAPYWEGLDEEQVLRAYRLLWGEATVDFEAPCPACGRDCAWTGAEITGITVCCERCAGTTLG
jgi:hypothetical protein